MDILHPQSSVLTVVRQYLSSLLHGQPQRLLLLWRSSGFDSFADWFVACPQEVRQVRRLAMLALRSTGDTARAVVPLALRKSCRR